MFTVSAVPIYQDNYVWIITAGNEHWVVDPGDHQPVIDYFTSREEQPNGILITHNHWDHVTGIGPLVEHYQIPVYGPDNPAIKGLDHGLKEGDTVALGPYQAQVLETPGHTLDHVSYYLPECASLFCGDTLFAAGCGRLFDGSMDQLYRSLQRLSQLPAETKVYCTHEYTVANLTFAQAAEPNNTAIADRLARSKEQRDRNLSTLPSNIGEERATNPFLRAHVAEIKAQVAQQTGQLNTDDMTTFAGLRNWKNRY